jgi:2-polyprenyl-3-methyl-5-hydroxy-6-metoxy-1,4-benzoquinol methylase
MIGKDYEYNAMANSERTLWWYRCLHALTLRQIRRFSTSPGPVILDAGCGTGGMISYLQEKGYRDIEGFDYSAYAVEYTNKTYGLKTKVLSILDVDATATDHSLFDVVISNDVLSVLPPGGDEQAIERLLAMLRPGGILIINLAALRAFYGMHDVALDVQKRYSKKEMRRLVGNKAVIRKMLYWPFLLSPVVFSIRWSQRMRLRWGKKDFVSDVKNPPPVLNTLFYGLTTFENRLMPTKPWGSSLLTVIQKKTA